MKKSRFTEEQIIAILEAAGGGDVRWLVELGREYAVSDAQTLCLEGQVRGDDRHGGASAAPAGGGESAPEALGRGLEFGSRSAQGGDHKKRQGGLLGRRAEGHRLIAQVGMK